MAPPIRTRPSFSSSQSLPLGSFHKLLILIHQGTDRMKTTVTENWPNWSHGPQPCLTQWNYELCHVGPTKMNELESSDKAWSTGEGNDKPLQYSCLENPKNSMNRQKDRTLKDELPRLVGAQYATGDQWRTNSRKKWSHSKNNTQVWMWLVIEVKC